MFIDEYFVEFNALRMSYIEQISLINCNTLEKNDLLIGKFYKKSLQQACVL